MQGVAKQTGLPIWLSVEDATAWPLRFTRFERAQKMRFHMIWIKAASRALTLHRVEARAIDTW